MKQLSYWALHHKLTILVALNLLYLLAFLSSNIVCNGSEGLAWIVLLPGTFGIVFLTIRIISRINKGPRKPKTATEKSSNNRQTST